MLRQARALLDKALAASPSDPEILKHASDFAGSAGRVREAWRLIGRAQEVDPLNQVIANNAAQLMADVGLTDQAFAAFAVAREKWPDFLWLIASPLLIAAHLGDWRTADPLIEMARSHPKELRMVLSTVDLLKAPIEVVRERMLATVERHLATAGAVELRVIQFMYLAGLKDEAFDALARSNFDHNRQGSPERMFLIGIIFGATSVSLRRDPRFVDLCGALGLCEYWVESGKWPDCVEEVAPHYDLKALARAFVEQHVAPCPPRSEPNP